MDFRGEDSIALPAGDTSYVSLHQPYPVALRDEYWASVKKVLVHVFHHDVNAADAARERLESFDYDKGQPLTIFYHADPFEVAADLAGRRMQEITPEEKARYQTVLRQTDRPPASHISATHAQDA